MLKDFVGQPLLVGDAVATTQRGYSDLVLFYVVGFTKFKIKLSKTKEYDPMSNNNCSKFPHQVSRVM